MGSSLKQRIQDDMKLAMRAKDSQRLNVIRLILAALKQIEVDERIELDDARISQILNKMLKQRRDAMAQYRQAGREDLAKQEAFEESIIQAYLPEPFTEKELDEKVTQVISSLGATSIKDMGRVMAELKQCCQGRADIAVLSEKVKSRLA